MKDLRDPIEVGTELLALSELSFSEQIAHRAPRRTLSQVADEYRHALDAAPDFDDSQDGPMCGLPPDRPTPAKPPVHLGRHRSPNGEVTATTNCPSGCVLTLDTDLCPHGWGLFSVASKGYILTPKYDA